MLITVRLLVAISDYDLSECACGLGALRMLRHTPARPVD
jgi:hypothetical protein